jgi:HAD superfamily hydrolase (TIGR01509 family)
VLADTRDARRAALADALAQRGLTLDDATLARAADAHASPVAVARAAEALSAARLDETDVDLLALAATRAFVARAAHGVALVSGARDALADLASQLRVVVVTRAPLRVAEQILAHAGLDAVVSAIVAAEHVVTPKPSPAGHWRALARLAHLRPIEPSHVVALEDGADGLAAARAAGVTVVGVGPGAHDATAGGAWVASAVALTYDALVHLLDSRAARGT